MPTGLPASTTIGRNVTIGQSCLLRSVTIEDEAVVGDKCVLLEGSLVEKNAGKWFVGWQAVGPFLLRVAPSNPCITSPHVCTTGGLVPGMLAEQSQPRASPCTF